ncbi:MAG: gamma-glutamylcyclotransferase [Polyangiaceae bacterium]|nr:gamma-glutamylcyclotransferase [Polyangiaceae bacterium]
MASSFLIFVYGSLKRSCQHHSELQQARYDGRAQLQGYRLVSYREGYPAIEPAPASIVHGETYWVSKGLLTRLDQFEEVPQLYSRTLLPLDDSRKAFAWVLPTEEQGQWPALQSSIWQARFFPS